MSSKLQDFGWASPAPGNGESGEGLADALLKVVTTLHPVSTVCDLGCGNGYISNRLARLGYDVTGVDASPSGIEIAEQDRSGARFITSVIDDGLPEVLGRGQFDLVITSDVIEHLYRPSDLLEASAALLKRDGRLIVGTPYHGYLKNVALSLSARMDAHFTALWDGGHIKFFSVRTLSALVRRHGFSDLEFTFYGRVPYLWKNMFCRARKAG